ncbi:MAG: hypothetical protein WBL31_18685, partial [Ilumatobacteraceae bacterium]
MQDHQAGHIGDFFKIGLLRWLGSPSPYGRGHRIGVVWFRAVDGAEESAGEPPAWLDPSSELGQDLRPLDPDLYDRLRQIAERGDGSVSALEAAGALPKGTVCFDQLLSFADLSPTDVAKRTIRRERWFHEAMVAVGSCSLVFVDSDEGLSDADGSLLAPRLLAGGDTSLSELGRLLERGQSVVTHHLVDHSDGLAEQVQARMTEIYETLGAEPLAAVRASRGATRLFMVIPHPGHRPDFQHRIGALQLSRWGDEFRV